MYQKVSVNEPHDYSRYFAETVSQPILFILGREMKKDGRFLFVQYNKDNPQIKILQGIWELLT